MTKQVINVGTSVNDRTGDSIRSAFQKVNANFTELYAGSGLSLGAFEFTGSVMTTTDSSAIVIDQATTITSDLTVGGDILPSTNLGGNLGSPTRQWKSLYVSTNTIYINNVPLSLDASNNLTVNGSRVGATSYNDLSDKPTFTGSTLVNGANTVSLGSDGNLTIPGDIRSEGNINIDINLADSTLRRWQFGEDGALTLPPGGTILNSSGQPYVNGLTSISSSVSTSIFTDASGDYQYGILDYSYAVNGNAGHFNIEYSRPLVDGNVDINVGNAVVTGDLTLSGDIRSDGNINIDINLSDSTLRRWQFGEDGLLTFPDGTNQSTAYTGGVDINLTNTGNVKIGSRAGDLTAGNAIVAIGTDAGRTAGNQSIAIGNIAGARGVNAIAVGVAAGYSMQGNQGIAIGYNAGYTSQGNYGIALGFRAGQNVQHDNTIIINANSGLASLDSDGTDRFYVSPIRNSNSPSNLVYYNTSTKEVTYGSLPTATTSVLGGVKVDGSTVTISDGVISVSTGLAGSVTFKGGWDANTNTPALANGAGTSGWMYIVTTNGVTNLGAGLVSYNAGDLVIYDGTNWINVAANNGVVSFNSRTGAVTLTSGDVTTALGFTPYNASNPNSYISSIDSSAVTTALGYTPYNATNPSNYITTSSLSVTTNTASGAGSLSYSAGVFTFTPAAAYALPTATTSTLGGIKIDNNTIVINDGVISVGGALTSATIFKGSWAADTNTPTLSNSLPTGVAAGWEYIVSVAGTRDIGAGSTAYSVGDLVIYNGTTWSRIPGGNNVTAFNSRQGAITLTSSDVTTALGFTPISLASVSGYQFYVAADDSTQQLVSSDEVIKFIGARGVTTTSDPEGAITITGPDLTTYATQSYVTSRGYLTSVDYSIVTNKPVIPDQFTFNVAADDSTMRTIGSEETIKFIGSGGITTTTDAEGNVNIILGSLNAVNLVGTTLATGVVNSSLTSVGTLTRLNVSRDVTARGFNTDSITMIGNRIATTVTNANLEIEFSGTGGLVANNVADATLTSTAKSVGYLGLPQSTTAAVSNNTTLVIGDAGKHIYITTTGQTVTIPAAGSVAYPIGTTLTFIAGPSATTVSIAITADTLRLAGGTSTGTRTLAANGMATAVKVSGASSSGVWYINGTGLT